MGMNPFNKEYKYLHAKILIDSFRIEVWVTLDSSSERNVDRRRVLKLTGSTVASIVGAGSPVSAQSGDEDDQEGEETESCVYCDEYEEKETWTFTREGDLRLESAVEEWGEPGYMSSYQLMEGEVTAEWNPLDYDANQIRIDLEVYASAWDGEITDAPPGWTIHGDRATYSTTFYDDNKVTVPYGGEV